jgi:uncharacterized coiled-coil protein SlyX
VEKESTWKTKTPEKAGIEQEKRMATIEKTQAAQSTLASTLTETLGRTRMECNKVLTKASIAIEDSNRAVNALMKHLAALDDAIEKFEKIVASSDSASKYLEGQVKAIADHLAKLTNVPKSAGRNSGEDGRTRKRSQSKQGRIGRGASKKAKKAGQESEQAKARMMTHAPEGEATKLILQEPDQEMEDVRNKREREESRAAAAAVS